MSRLLLHPQSVLCCSQQRKCISTCTLRSETCRGILISPVSIACRGVSKETRGTAYIVYEDIYDAKTAVEHLSGFNVANRYLIVLYYNTAKQNKKASVLAASLPCPGLLRFRICGACSRHVSGSHQNFLARPVEPGEATPTHSTRAVSAGQHKGKGGGGALEYRMAHSKGCPCR